MTSLETTLLLAAMAAMAASFVIMWRRSNGFRSALTLTPWIARLWVVSMVLAQTPAWMSMVRRAAEGEWVALISAPFLILLGVVSVRIYRELADRSAEAGTDGPTRTAPLLSVRTMKLMAVGTFGFAVSWMSASALGLVL